MCTTCKQPPKLEDCYKDDKDDPLDQERCPYKRKNGEIVRPLKNETTI